MKTLKLLLILGLLSSIAEAQPKLTGAWINVVDGTTTMRIYTEGFFAVSIFSKEKFIGTFGGSYQLDGKKLTEKIEFDTQTLDRIGKQFSSDVKMLARSKSADEIFIGDVPYNRVDDGTPGKLAGAWLITGRFTDGEMKKNTPGARRTMKILSGTRFQWIAYNVETKEFFGTGGGTYTTANGQYTENIDFFSRDQTRVGMSLGFDYSIMNDGTWRHSGKSSKGEPIDEVWTMREKLGM